MGCGWLWPVSKSAFWAVPVRPSAEVHGIGAQIRIQSSQNGLSFPELLYCSLVFAIAMRISYL